MPNATPNSKAAAWSRRPRAWLASLANLIPMALLLGCGGGDGRPVGVNLGPPGPQSHALSESVGAPPPLPHHAIARVPQKTLGPLSARDRATGKGIVAYLDRFKPNAARFVARPFGREGVPTGRLGIVGMASAETDAFAIGASGSPGGGFALAWTALASRGKSLHALGIAADGRPNAKPAEIVATTNDIGSVEIVPTKRGTLVFWLEIWPSGKKELHVVPLDGAGKASGLPMRLAASVEAVSFARSADAVHVVYVESHAEGAATIKGLAVGADGRIESKAVELHRAKSAVGSLAVTEARGKPFAAWREKHGLEDVVFGCTIDLAAEKHCSPKPLLPPISRIEIVGLVGGPSGVLLAWDDPERRGRTSRSVYWVTLGQNLKPDLTQIRSATIVGHDDPEFVSRARGFVMLAETPVCVAKSPVDACPRSKSAYTIVALGADGRPEQVEVARVVDASHEPRPAAMAWGVDCSGGECLALAATGDTEPVVATVHLVGRKNGYALRSNQLDHRRIARASAVRLVTGEDDVIELATIRTTKSRFVLTLAEPKAPDASGMRGVVRAHVMADEKKGVEPVRNLVHAQASLMGGVALCRAPGDETEAVAVFASLEGPDAQVRVVRLAADGQVKRQRLVTKNRGGASSIACASDDKQIWLAWVDRRDGNGEVYAARLGPDLDVRVGPKRVTRAKGDASDTALIKMDDRVVIAYADAREAPTTGVGDIYVSRVDPATLERDGDEIRVVGSAAHSRSPRLAASGRSFVVAWIEDAPPEHAGTAGQAYGLMTAWIDASGKLAVLPQRAELGGGVVHAVDLLADGDAIRGVFVRSDEADVVLEALAIEAPGRLRHSEVVMLDSPPPFDARVGIDTRGVVFTDASPKTRGRRVRRVDVTWLEGASGPSPTSP